MRLSSRIFGFALLIASLGTIYAVVTDEFVTVVIGIEVAVLAGLLIVLKRKKPIDDGLAGRPE